MRQFFLELKNDIMQAINNDIENLFPSILTLNNNSDSLHKKVVINPINVVIEDKINDLKNMFIIHLTGKYDLNLCYAVISAIIAFEKDFKQNNRIRNRILPLI